LAEVSRYEKLKNSPMSFCFVSIVRVDHEGVNANRHEQQQDSRGRATTICRLEKRYRRGQGYEQRRRAMEQQMSAGRSMPCWRETRRRGRIMRGGENMRAQQAGGRLLIRTPGA
jgi:hypothetical protein